MMRLFGRAVLLTAPPLLTPAVQVQTPAAPNPDNYLDDPDDRLDPYSLINSSSFLDDVDVIVFSFDRKEKAHMLNTVFTDPYSFKYAVANREGLPMNVRFVQAAFDFVRKRKPKLALWLFPMAEAADSLRQAVLPVLGGSFAAAKLSSPSTKHGVFHWAPEYCHTFKPSEVHRAYEGANFVFQFGYQDERLARIDSKYMPWPLGPAEWRSWRTPNTKRLRPLSQRDHLAVFRGSNNTHGKAFDVNVVTGYPGVVAEVRGNWAFSDGQADVNRYVDLLTAGQYALSPQGHNPNCFRVQEAVESGAIPVVVLGDLVKPGSCYSDWAALYGLPAGSTRYPWIPTAPFYVLPSWSDLGSNVEAMRAGATDQAGENLRRWYAQWLAAFHDRLELIVRAALW